MLHVASTGHDLAGNNQALRAATEIVHLLQAREKRLYRHPASFEVQCDRHRFAGAVTLLLQQAMAKTLYAEGSWRPPAFRASP